MPKGSLKYIASFIFAIIIIGVSAYMVFGGSEEVSTPSAVRETSSYQNLKEAGSLEKKTFNISTNYLSYSQNHDFPYGFEEAPERSDFKRLFTILVDFGEFKEEKSRIFIARNDREGYIYQLKNGEVISETKGFDPIGEYNRAYNNLTMCRNSSIHLESVKTSEYSTDVNISNPGSKEFNGNYRGKLNLTFTRTNGSNTTKTANTILLPDSKKQYDLSFEITNGDKITKVEMKPVACPAQTQTVTELPLN